MAHLTRRALLKGVGTLACSTAAHPLMTSATFASAPWDARLVVIILRGAMDGLAALQPVGDPDLQLLRPGFQDPAKDLDGFYAMHAGLAALMPLWSAQELAFAHAVSTPYRDKRSHFDGQDLLEAGTAMDAGSVRDGWLNRMMQTVPGVSGRTAFAIGRESMKVLSGPAEVANWAPDT
ncbi:MAG: twin-arginine translocation pathway signal, partial [Pseudomonadota bacterium]